MAETPVVEKTSRAEVARVQADEGSESSALLGGSASPRGRSGKARARAFIYAFVAGCLCMWWISAFSRYTALLGRHHKHLTVEQRADKILTENPLIDGHNDLMILLRYLYKNRIYGSDFKDKFENGGMPYHVDLPRLDRGKVGGAFWSAFVPCPRNGSDFSDGNYAPSVRATLEQLDLFHRLSAAYPKYFTPAPSHRAALHAFSHSHLISPTAIEGLHQIGNSLSTLRLYHRLGVRYATLTWNCHNAYADAALLTSASGDTVVAPPLWGGVSPAGRTLVAEMNRLGMMVDLSHVSVATMRDVLGGSAASKNWTGSLAPPIFSHSSAYALCPHPRNVPDDILDLVRRRGSLVMVNFSPDFISCVPASAPGNGGLPDIYERNNTLAQVVRHVMYIGDRIGYDHVGLGTDFDGIASAPAGLEDVSRFPSLVAEMLRRGVSDRNAAKVVGRNLLRVWKEVDRVAERLQREMPPVEDQLPDMGAMELGFDWRGELGMEAHEL
ncbi:membrane dipeptidase [Cryomyces antarcticus]